MPARRAWSREELLLAINLYCRTPFGKIHTRNPELIALAEAIGRTPSAVSWKRVNFAHIDPTLDRQGAAHASKLDRETWEEFFTDWDSRFIDSERLRDQYGLSTENEAPVPTGIDVRSWTTSRRGQHAFRREVLAAYNETCCITGLDIPSLLQASHIIPWSVDPSNRLNPANGLCLNVLHHEALDRRLISINADCRVTVSAELKRADVSDAAKHLIVRYEGITIQLPQRFRPFTEAALRQR